MGVRCILNKSNSNSLKDIYELCAQNGYDCDFEQFKIDLTNALNSNDLPIKMSNRELETVSAGISNNQKKLMAGALSLILITNPATAHCNDSIKKSEAPSRGINLDIKNKIIGGINTLKKYKKEAIVCGIILGAGIIIPISLLGKYNYVVKSKLEMIFGKDTIKYVSNAKYMDEQKEEMWCQFYAFQGMLKKCFNIKCKVTELYDIAFLNEQSVSQRIRDTHRFMETNDVRMDFIEKMKTKYNIKNMPYIYIKNVNEIDKNELIRIFVDAYKKCYALCINCCVFGGYEHALLITDINENKNEITIETWGKSITFKLDDMVTKYIKALQSYNSNFSAKGVFRDGKLKIYGFLQ